MATLEPTSPALLLFTSGSTAAAKGVIHGHGDLLAEVDGLARAHELVDSDGMLVALPVSHIGGTVYGMLLTLGAGVRATFLDAWDPSVALRLIEDDGLTVFSGVPTYLDGILGAARLHAPPGRQPPALRHGRHEGHPRRHRPGRHRLQLRLQAQLRLHGSADAHHRFGR